MLAFAQSPELWQTADQMLKDQYNIIVCHDESTGKLVKSLFVQSTQCAMVLSHSCRFQSAAQNSSIKQEDDKVECLLNSPIKGRVVKEGGR
ncbi:hypothetical protein NLJ89_g4324 [Agrocybe chaxingu]|uniref:Uncharacterized protein n=1 Tax=Agrocybe chaxingu TaxID=84603 RepID=A0A9W8K3I8_9AGAR|nr:hypothetical protein NLJ89_g4324 [Agrocybe chaxingu]